MTKGRVEIEGVLREESANLYLINVVTPVELNAKLIKFPILYKDGREFTTIVFRE